MRLHFLSEGVHKSCCAEMRRLGSLTNVMSMRSVRQGEVLRTATALKAMRETGIIVTVGLYV